MSKSMIAYTLSLLALMGVVLAGGCGSSSPRGGTLADTSWQLSAYSVEGEMKDVPSDVYVDLLFAKDRVSGKALNSFTGPYEATEDGDVSIGPLASTKMAGPEPLMALEDAYFAALEKTTGFYATDEALTLYDEDDKELLTFKVAESQLTGREWKVTSFNNGQGAVVGVIATSTVTATFGEDGQVSGNSGVNTYGAEFKTSGTNAIEIGMPRSTLMAGPEDLMEQEQLYLAALQTAATYLVRGSELEMRTADDELAVMMTSAP